MVKLSTRGHDPFLIDGTIEPIHPGVLFKKLVANQRKESVVDMARHVGVSRAMLYRLFKGKAAVTTKTAIGLASVAGNAPEFWLRLQNVYSLWVEQKRITVRHRGGHQAEKGTVPLRRCVAQSPKLVARR